MRSYRFLAGIITLLPALQSCKNSTGPEPIPSIVGHVPLDRGPFGSVFSESGTAWIGLLNGTAVRSLNVATQELGDSARTGPAGSLPVQVYANAAGTRLYVGNFGGVVASISTSSPGIVDSVRVSGDVYGMTATPAGDTVFAGVTTGRIYKIALASRTILDTLTLGVAAGYHFAWNQARTLLYAASRDANAVYEIDPGTLSVVRTFAVGGAPQTIGLSSNGAELYVAREGASDLVVWNVAANAAIDSVSLGCPGYGLVLASTSRLYVSCALAGRVIVINPTTRMVVKELETGGEPRALSFDATTRNVVAPNASGWVDIVH